MMDSAYYLTIFELTRVRSRDYKYLLRGGNFKTTPWKRDNDETGQMGFTAQRKLSLSDAYSQQNEYLDLLTAEVILKETV